MQAKTFYDDKGKIISTVYGELSIVSFEQWADLNCIDQYAEADIYWIKDGEILEREENPAKLSGLTINNIPCQGKLIIDGSEYDVSGSSIDLDLPEGKYKITLDCFPYLPKVFEVEK